MKRIARLILGCLCFASIILAGGETPDGGIDILWTLSWIAVAYLSARYWKKLGGRTMRYLHTLDPDELRMMSEQDRRDLEDYARAAELAREDAVMEK